MIERQSIRNTYYAMPHIPEHFTIPYICMNSGIFRFLKALFLGCFLSFLMISTLYSQEIERNLTSDLHHLRTTDIREWSDFPETNELKKLQIQFSGEINKKEYTLQLRQINVKQNWKLSLNNKTLGTLHLNEGDITAYFPIPIDAIKPGDNELLLEQMNDIPDDIRVGEIKIFRQPVANILKQSEVDIRVSDRDTAEPLPSRITIVNEHESLQTFWPSLDSLATVRPGVIYTGNGSVKFFLPKGNYTIYAGRGMEFGVDSTKISVTETGQIFEKALSIDRQVDTNGYISSDTHLHTFTHSRHGDASIHERMLTIAGEGIEFPIATDHNLHIDYRDAAKEMRVHDYFTPVIGNEVTTPLGHFNIFPAQAEANPPKSNLNSWGEIFKSIYKTPGVSVVIFNHGRDIHGGFRPLDYKYFNAVTGTFHDDFNPQFNAMEVLNSGALQSDMMQLFRDWFAMTNRGYSITPVAGSDSHDVSRYIAGQARTYIQLRDEDPSNIDISEAAERVAEGKLNIGMGLFTTMNVNGNYSSGDLVPVQDSINVHINVQGPDWVTADRIELYRNGQKIRSEKISSKKAAGLKWEGTWKIKTLGHDSFLVAIAKGPGIKEPYWPIARPWEPKSIDWNPEIIGATGAVWLDEDGNGERNSAFEYALSIVDASGNSLKAILNGLEKFDSSVSIQAAGIYFRKNNLKFPLPAETLSLIETSAKHVRKGMNTYLDYQRELAQSSR